MAEENLVFFTLLSKQSVSRLGIQLYIIPLVSIVGGILALNEWPSPAIVPGGIILLLGMTIRTGAHP
jgi:drug/metabolite transporter (DMT)-like permease